MWHKNNGCIFDTIKTIVFLVSFDGLIKCNLENRTVENKTLAMQSPYSGLIICPSLISKKGSLSIDSEDLSTVGLNSKTQKRGGGFFFATKSFQHP